MVQLLSSCKVLWAPFDFGIAVATLNVTMRINHNHICRSPSFQHYTSFRIMIVSCGQLRPAIVVFYGIIYYVLEVDSTEISTVAVARRYYNSRRMMR